MWKDYLLDDKPFWDENKVPILQVHCSGHAYIDDLQRFAAAIRPKCIIPIHTFFPEKYFELLGRDVKLIKDRETVEI